MDGRQACVASADRVTSFLLQIGEEGSDDRSVKVSEVQFGGRLARALAGEVEQEPPQVSIGVDGPWAGLTLGDQPVSKVGLQGGADGTHCSFSRKFSRRPTACASRSGVACKYQYVATGPT